MARRQSSQNARATADGTRGGESQPARSDRRPEILAIAARIIATKGYASATVRDIGDEAGILSGSLYHYFESKDAMLEEILSGVLEELVEQYAGVAKARNDPYESLEQLVLIGLRFVVEQRHAATIFQNDFAYLRRIERFGFINDKNTKIRDSWRDVLRRGAKENVFNADLDVDLAYRAIMGTILSTVRWFDPAGERSIEDVARGLTAIFFHGFKAGAASAPTRSQRRVKAT